MRGKKGERHDQPDDPPRRRGNQRRGHGTYAQDRPPIVGTIGRVSGQVRLRVARRVDHTVLHSHIQQFTQPQSILNTDTWNGYNKVPRQRVTVDHGKNEWARDDDGDGIREVHVNTTEGMWAGVRTYLRPFRGVHKRYLSGYIAICEFRINLKAISPDFISRLVRFQVLWT